MNQSAKRVAVLRSVRLLAIGAIAGLGPFPGSSANAWESEPGRPNIVLVFADDFGYGEIQALNPMRGKIPTPNLNRMTTQSMLFTDAHSASSVCTPSRYALLTGRYCWRSRLQQGVLTGNDEPLIAADRPTVQGLLQQQGYHTAVIGKWHLNYNYEGDHQANNEPDRRGNNFITAPAPIGTRIPDGPLSRGFDYYFGFHHSREMSSLCENDRIVEEIDVVEMLPRLTSKAAEHIRQRAAADQPFFLYLPLSSPHTPIVPSKEWIGRSGLGPYGDFVMQTDGTVGVVMDAIEEAGISDNTLLIFTCDNGTSRAANFADLNSKGHYPSAHLRGSKADIWDGGHRIPLIVRWPNGNVGAGTESDQLVCLSDFYATIAEMLGAEIEDDAAEDSFSFFPALRGDAISNPRRAIVHHSISGHFAIRKQNWKLCLAYGSGGWSAPNEKQAKELGHPDVQLYDMDVDVGEQQNLQAQYPDRTRELLDLLHQYVQRGRSTPGVRRNNDSEIDLWKSK